MTSTNTLPPAGMFRRLGALFYDALIVLAIEMMEMLPQSWRRN